LPPGQFEWERGLRLEERTSPTSLFVSTNRSASYKRRSTVKKIGILVVLLLALALFSACTHTTATGVSEPSAPVPERILRRGELVVDTSGEQPPLTAKTKEGKIIGLDADLATYMANAMGVKPKFEVMPFSELLPALEAGKLDMILSGMTMTPQRNLKVAFVGPYYISGKGLLTKIEEAVV